MRKLKLFITFIALALISCERDDICAEATATTPRLLIEFYDVASPDDLKSVLRLTAYGEGLVVDENGMEFSLAFTESKLPLTLEELVTFINESTYKDDTWKGGLIVSHWNYQYDSEGDAQEAIDFISIESAWYPELADWYEIHGREWSAEKGTQEKD